MKKYFLLFILIVATLPMHAEQMLAVIWAKDGRLTYFAWANNPVISVSGNTVIVDDSVVRGNSISLSIAELNRFELRDMASTPVESVKNEIPIVVRLTENGLETTGLKSGEMVYVYDLNGRLIGQMIADIRGCGSLPLRSGTYVVRAGSKTFKILKR